METLILFNILSADESSTKTFTLSFDWPGWPHAGGGGMCPRYNSNVGVCLAGRMPFLNWQRPLLPFPSWNTPIYLISPA